MVIAGLKCRGTSNTLIKIPESTSGVGSLVTFVSEFKAVILYNPDQTDGQSIQRGIEAGLDLKDHKTGMMKRFFPFKVEKIL